MKLTLSEVLARLNQMRATIDGISWQSADAPQRARTLVALLRDLGPEATLHACLLDGGELPGSCIIDQKGKERPEWLAPLAAVAGADMRAAEAARDSGTLPSCADFDLPGQRLIWEVIGASQKSIGLFALAVPHALPADSEVALRTLLQTAAALVAGRLDVQQRQQPAARDELAVNLALADWAEVGGPVAHEFNNFLNALLLHIAVLELKMTPEQRHGLADLRQQGKGIAKVVQQWQNYHRRPPGASQSVDLNTVAREAVQALTESEPRVRLELTTESVVVPGLAAEIKRLVTFLLRSAVAVTPPDGTVTVRTGREADMTFLRIQDAGPALDPLHLAEFFDLGPVRRDGRNSLELAACKTFVRRLQGKITAENAGERGVLVSVEMPGG